ncbi:ABC-type uncharacterized transport system, permease component [Dermatophilus congolensis]|uniref:ABC-type uncharacterized transport system, permease component n=2 Tax=Dermatophilus congolensis TaxID=1863 RepID=A0AA46BL31_9MICO|nr:ABC-type uncharacterized transport system, permease component [Dermatophilus congolensis]
MMTNQQLALLSNYALYAAMAMLSCAMIGYAIFLGVARAATGGSRVTAENEQTPVTAGNAPVPPEGARTADKNEKRLGIGSLDSSGLGILHGSAVEELSNRKIEEVDARSGAIATMLGWLGTMTLFVSMVLRGLSVQRAPVSNMFEFAVAAAFLIMAVFLGLGLKRPLKWMGVFVVTPVLLMLGLAITVWYAPAAELVPSLKSTWLVIHVPIAILATAVFTLAFVVLLLHLAKARHERKLREGTGKQASLLALLPDAAALDRASYALHITAFPLWTFTLIAGAIWGQKAWGIYWSWDPKEVWTFVIWVIYAAYLHSRATSGWSLKKSNVIAVIGYMAIIVNFTIVNMFFPGMHSYSGL